MCIGRKLVKIAQRDILRVRGTEREMRLKEEKEVGLDAASDFM